MDGTNDLVSVIIPVYNVERYLDACVRSIVGQSHENIEIILVDDGSSDESGKRCDVWAGKDGRIKVIHKVNGGLNYARRDGVRRAVGEWVCFVDSDDLVHESYVEDLLLAAVGSGVDIAVARNRRFVNDKDVDLIEWVHDGRGIVVKNRAQIMWHVLVQSPDPAVFMMTAWGKIFRRQVIEEINWGFSNARANEDELEAIQYYNLQRRGVMIVKKALYFYRDNPNSIMNKTYANKYEGKKYSRFEWIEKLFELSVGYLGVGNYADELLYHNVMLNLLFLNRDLDRGVFTDDDARIFTRNFYPKMALYEKIEEKYPLRYEELRAYRAIRDGGLFAFWSDDRHKTSCLLERLKWQDGEIRALRQEIDNMRLSRAYRIGTALAAPYQKLKKSFDKDS